MRIFLIASLVGVSSLMNITGTGFGLSQIAYAETEITQENDFKTLLELAEKGDVKAQTKIAFKYERGDGFPANFDKAFKWYLKAANNGDAAAQLRLGQLYFSGRMFPKDIEKAVEWSYKAVAQGYTWAHCDLAPRYLAGIDVKKDAKKGIDLLTEASELGDVNCQLSLAMYYYLGEYIPKDIEKAAYWFSKAAEQGNRYSKERLDEINGITKPSVKMVNNKDRQDFQSLYREYRGATSAVIDCLRGGYSIKECTCALEEEYDDLRKTLKITVERHGDWEGKNIHYRNKKGHSVGFSFDGVRGQIRLFDQMCKE